MGKVNCEFDVECLSKNIKDRINNYNKEETKEVNNNLLLDINKMLEDIDAYLTEAEKDDELDIDVDEITREVNQKLEGLDSKEEDELEKTLYDLSEISNMIKETISKLEKEKEKKRKKAMYCEQARRSKYKKYTHNKKK